MSISVSKQSQQIAKLNLSNFDENTFISFLIEILQHLNALSCPFHTPNLLHVDFSDETIPANRKTQSFKFLRKLCYFVPYWNTTAFKCSLHSILYAERYCMSITVTWQSLENAKRNLSNFDEHSVISFLISDTTAFKRTFHSILHADCIACRFQCRNNPCKSQNAIFETARKTLLFRSWLRCFDV
jgi:hypothetical protein